MKPSKAIIAFIKRFESCRLRAYLCPAGVPTIGYGHTGPDVTKADIGRKIITQEQADELFVADLAHFTQGIEKLVKVKLTQYQFDALLSFTFNVGLGALQSSTLLRVLNAGNYNLVPQQLQRWTRGAGGKEVLAGLVRRRNSEIVIWGGGSYD